MADPISSIANLVGEIVGSKKGKWVRRLVSLAAVVDQLRKDDVPNEDDPVLKAAEEALKRHLEKLHE